MESPVPIRCLIVDDDPLDRAALAAYLAAWPELTVVGQCETAAAARPLVLAGGVDVLLLDIDMPGQSGLDFFRSLPAPPVGVFVTSHPEFALDGFELHALDYLVKPVNRELVSRMAGRLTEYWEIRRKAERYDTLVEADRIRIKEGSYWVSVAIDDIEYLEALRDYTRIQTPTRRHLTLTPLKNLLEALPAERFVRIHRSYAVQVRHVTRATPAGVWLAEGREIPVGRTYRPALLRYFAI